MTHPERCRVRIRFCKTGKIRWTSHRDVARMWERAFRRVQLPVAYSSGFSPRPKVSFGLALPTGHESVAEYIDVELLEIADVTGLPERLSAALPVGVDATAAAVIPSSIPSLQEEVSSCSWRWRVVLPDGEPVDEQELAARVAGLLAASYLPVFRKGSQQDIRPGILSLTVSGGWLEAELACHPRSIRPSEVTAAMGDLEERDVRRTYQWIWRDDAREEPLAAIGAQHAEVRAR